jgi:3-hydroxyisobutyrate dehydrogenase-like beta-hydroxyacid dehydrogenase
MPIVAIPAAGSMGAAVGARLVQHGVEVSTLSGRSAASQARAGDAGMTQTSEEGIAGSDFVLSILPPDRALELAERLAPALSASSRKPVYVDCNAVNPVTVNRVAATIEPTGCRFVDASIIGLPPREGRPGPRFYASGDSAPALAELGAYGIDVRVLALPVGAASALKMSYAGITKGLVAIGSAMTLAATRAGISEPLSAELAASQPSLHSSFTRSIPDMFTKAERWVPELSEIAAFVGDEYPESRIFEAIASFYRRMADGAERDDPEVADLKLFWTPAPQRPA